MALQSTLFSPALNGSIPELYPAVYVNRANANLKVVTTVAILLGISVSGFALSRKGAGWGDIPMGRLVVGLTVVAISALGLLASFGVYSRPAASPQAKLPWTGPLDTLRQLAELRKDWLLSVVVLADTFLWFVGSLLIQLVNVFAIKQLGRGEDVAGYMVAMEVVGIAIGGLIGGRVATGQRWYRVIAPGVLSMAALLAAMAAVPMLPGQLRLLAAFPLLGLVGMAGGVVLIPCEGFVQVRPAGDRKGVVIASVNFAIFCGILLSGPVANVLVSLMRPSAGFGAAGVASLLVGLWLWRVLGKERVAGFFFSCDG